MEVFDLIYRISRKIPGGGTLLRMIYSCDIPKACRIDPSVRFGHRALGTVIHRNVTIESGCFIQHHVTIGMNDIPSEAPHIHKNVFIGPYAMILGGVEIGENSKIGAGAIVLHDVPANTIYFDKRIPTTKKNK